MKTITNKASFAPDVLSIGSKVILPGDPKSQAILTAYFARAFALSFGNPVEFEEKHKLLEEETRLQLQLIAA